MPEKKKQPQTEEPKEEAPQCSGERNASDEDPAKMDLDEFVAKFRKRVQEQLWNRPEKISVADLVRLSEIEIETEKLAANKRPTELRVVWINKTSEITT